MSTTSRPRFPDDSGAPELDGSSSEPPAGAASALDGLDIANFRELARTRLERFPRIEVPDAPGMRRAAVVLCVVPGAEGALAVLVIKRAYRGRNAGQWGLPGGRMEAGESAEQAALRELHEELALPADPGDILGVLDDFPATSGFAITPVVVTMPGLAGLRPHPDEVHSVHFVPLTRLAAQDVPHWLRRADFPDGPDLLQMRLGPRMTIHAPTGAMLWQFREVVLLGSDPAEARVAHFAQPDWTRR
ncbi:NUDIX hydrolase [Nocardia higoensis]|uniref:NUDIX hydrolase n=1 Tax=Nocardia higoensis TaxID=228599 RepID=UPI000A065296|nr:CoA pyrophosphatase [Nocardia higoensis]